MPEYKPTPSQAQAIESRGSAVLVSAGAGSGKTRVLTERLIARLQDEEHPADLDSFLIITFTKAAAGELRGRILEELAKALARDPGNRHLRRQSALLRRAHIGTIHSFCGALLRENSHLAGLSPDFRIMDEDRAQTMKEAALERVLERCYARPEEHPGFLQMADTVGAGRNDQNMADAVLDLYEKMRCQARPRQWAARQAALLEAPYVDAGESPWGRELLAGAAEAAAYWSDAMDALMGELLGEPKAAKAYLPSAQATADGLRELERCAHLGWEKTRACFPIEFPRLGGLKNPPDPELAERFKARRKACKTAMDSLERAMSKPSEQLLSELRQTIPAMKALLALVEDFEREYSRDKRRANVVDYSDLEHGCAALLTEEDGTPTELARSVSRRFTEIMVDEYQDVSRVQEAIFSALSREGKNLFMVGDVKQAIYRFRLADPRIFLEKYDAFAPAEQAGEGEARRILLRENFRSRKEVLDGANRVFSLCMSRALGDVAYDEAAALVHGAKDVGPGVLPELMLLPLTGGDGENETEDKVTREAAMVAGKIRELLDGGATVAEDGRQRPLRCGDIAILLRSANKVGPIYRRELSRLGLPSSSAQGDGFFRTVEVSAVTSLLAVLDDPHQDIALIAVLRSPAMNFSADELSAIRAADRKGDFYAALCAWAEQNEKGRAFLALLDRLRREAPDLSMAELVWRLLEEMDLLAVCSAMADGAGRRARLMTFISLAESYERSGYRGLHRFVLWLRRMAEREREPAAGTDSGAAVQILSVHKSKGLEFPVVFLSDTGRRFNKSDSRDQVLVHQDLGLGPKVTDLERRMSYPSLARSAIQRRLDRETLSEEMRLLYVAMTRARERLYMTAALNDPEKTIQRISATLTEPMAPLVLAGAGSWMEWLLAAALIDDGRTLKLSVCRPETEEAAESRLPENCPPDPAAEAELARRLAFRYPHAAAAALPSKITATEMKGRQEPDEEAGSILPRRHRPFRMPDFTRADKPVTGAEKGTATHLVLQVMDFGKTDSPEAVRGEILRLQAAGFLSEREAAAVDAEAICRLFASPLGRRMLAAESLKREFKFSLLVDAEQVYGRAPGEQLLLQGVVDCYLEENGALTVIDYKTDTVRSRAGAEKRGRYYAGQLRSYAAALRRITGKPVKECLLYFLAVDEIVAVEI